ncbi:MAG: hypothetical protein WAN12_13150 [Candidatus Acidiferrum sp.]
MNYTKPEITSRASASFLIQSTQEKQGGAGDTKSVYEITNSAYEADE